MIPVMLAGTDGNEEIVRSLLDEKDVGGTSIVRDRIIGGGEVVTARESISVRWLPRSQTLPARRALILLRFPEHGFESCLGPRHQTPEPFCIEAGRAPRVDR
jgi:hypothetical protein